MNQIQMSLTDNDFVVQAKTIFGIDRVQSQALMKFFNRLTEELMIGETEILTIEGFQGQPVNFRISATD